MSKLKHGDHEQPGPPPFLLLSSSSPAPILFLSPAPILRRFCPCSYLGHASDTHFDSELKAVNEQTRLHQVIFIQTGGHVTN